MTLRAVLNSPYTKEYFLPMQEEKIIRDCKNQDRNAQRKLYEQYSGQMYSICLRYCNQADMAADALQEGFINIFRFINSNFSGH